MPPINIYYDEAILCAGANSAFPHEKFSMIRDDWASRFRDQVAFPSFAPATAGDVKSAHDPDFVDDILCGRLRNAISGVDPVGGTASLVGVGGHLHAVRHTLRTGTPTVGIVSGFHHARYGKSHAFCVFNGLMVAAMKLLASGFPKKIAVIDLDAHFGDGTQDIIDRLDVRKDVLHYSYARQLLERGREVDEWLDGLADVVASLHSRGVGMVLYNSGVDTHVDDPMIRGTMTTEQIRRRERIVFETCRSLSLPVSWILAGGYQKPLDKVVHLHGLAMEECLAAWS